MSYLVRFIDRESELKGLREWCSKQRTTPLYLYGPEGCGKTRLLKEFVKDFRKYFGKRAIAIYIDALERTSLDRAILTSSTIKVTKDILRDVIESFMGSPLGKVLAETIPEILERAIAKERFRNNYILVAIDDVTRAIGLDQIEWYVKWLYELMWKFIEDYNPKVLNFIVTTSEGESLRLIQRHRHAHIRMIWNLDKEAFEELFYELKPPTTLEFEDVWNLLSGNPGKLMELAQEFEWNINYMIQSYKRRLKEVVELVIGLGLLKELNAVIENPDSISKISSEKMLELKEILIENNLIMRISFQLDFTLPKPNFSIGLGREYAWQVALYRHVLKQIIEETK